MKNHYFKSAFVLCVLILFLFNAKTAQAQYEQKLTLHGSGTFILPNIVILNEDDFLNGESPFSAGLGAEGGLQFNPNRYVSLMANARMYDIYGTQDYDVSFFNIAFGGGIKLNLAGRKRVNPYLFAEGNFNLAFTEIGFPYPESPSGQGYYKDNYATIGAIAGLGFDFRLNDHFGFFIQSGGYYTIYDSYVNLFNQFGIRISLIKARTI